VFYTFRTEKTRISQPLITLGYSPREGLFFNPNLTVIPGYSWVGEGPPDKSVRAGTGVWAGM